MKIQLARSQHMHVRHTRTPRNKFHCDNARLQLSPFTAIGRSVDLHSTSFLAVSFAQASASGESKFTEFTQMRTQQQSKKCIFGGVCNAKCISKYHHRDGPLRFLATTHSQRPDYGLGMQRRKRRRQREESAMITPYTVFKQTYFLDANARGSYKEGCIPSSSELRRFGCVQISQPHARALILQELKSNDTAA
jgi:hypothetical protein